MSERVEEGGSRRRRCRRTSRSIENGGSEFARINMLICQHPSITSYYKRQDTTYAKKKRNTVFRIVKIVDVFKKYRTIAVLMREDVRNLGKLVWRPYDEPFLSKTDFFING